MKPNDVTKALAIVIPYYKINHFKNVLDALAKQINQNFNIYIGDDASPNSPEKLIEEYQEKLHITYQRFEKNLGGKYLVAQWHRCLEMVEDEEWVWVLPDDDVPSENVVEAFYKALKQQKKYNIKVMRLPMSVIDKEGKLIEQMDFQDPLVEDNLAFYERVVRGKAAASLGDNIFHKESLMSSGGFVSFPKAWGSDHATVLRASAGGTLYFLEQTRLYFRMSGDNISSDKTDGLSKIKARILFANWLKENENIFLSMPSETFYRNFYWKGEYYVLHEWDFDIKLFVELYRLRSVCFRSKNILPVMKVLLMKLGLLKK